MDSVPFTALTKLAKDKQQTTKKANLPVNILTGNSYSKQNHSNRCQICKHPDIKQINALITTLSFRQLIDKYPQFTPNLIILHIDKLELLPESQELHRKHQLKTLIKLDTSDDVTISHDLAMNDQLAKQAGAYKANETPKSIQLFQQVNNILSQQAMSDNIAPTIPGNDAPQSVIDQDYNNDGAKGESNQ